jgi:outer membrane protein assembly factor BamE (lipoprotein component of BamABCDE complex)
MRGILLTALGLGVAGCALQQSDLAMQAQRTMTGKTKEQVLSCMGPPISKATEGDIEVWKYQHSAGASVQSNYNGATVRSRNCDALIYFASDRVQRLEYGGNTSNGILAPRAACGALIERCL